MMRPILRINFLAAEFRSMTTPHMPGGNSNLQHICKVAFSPGCSTQSTGMKRLMWGRVVPLSGGRTSMSDMTTEMLQRKTFCFDLQDCRKMPNLHILISQSRGAGVSPNPGTAKPGTAVKRPARL
jgi:hypothetical protein